MKFVVIYYTEKNKKHLIINSDPLPFCPCWIKRRGHLGSGSRAGMSKEEARCNGEISKFENPDLVPVLLPTPCHLLSAWPWWWHIVLHCFLACEMKGWTQLVVLWPALRKRSGLCGQEVSRPGFRHTLQRNKLCFELFHTQGFWVRSH